MAVYPDTLVPERLADRHGVELWRRTLRVGEGKVIILGAHHLVEDPDKGLVTEASVTVTSYCCPRCLPVSSVVIFDEVGDQAVDKVRSMESGIGISA